MLAASRDGAAYGLNLLPQHEALLRDSAIAPEVARARGYWSARSKAEVERLGFKGGQSRVPALVVPLFNAQGEPALHQLRPDRPRVDAKGKVIKYETPARKRLILDVHPSIGAQVCDASVPLWLTEGSRKADAASSVGLCCIALLGVWGWCRKDAKGKRRPLPDWASIPLDGREVVIVFDSDVIAKPEVHKALVALKQLLEARGARVSIAYLPPGDGGAKVGLDDYLATGHTVEELRALATTELRRPKARPALTPEIVTSGTPTTALFFDEKDHFIPARLGAWLMREAPVQLGHDRQLWRYEGGVYRAGGDDWAKHRTRQIVGERFRRNHLEEVNAWLRARIPSLGHAPPREFINCANGLLDWKTGVLHDHSPNVLTTNQIPVDWTPGAKAPTVERFLREIVPDDCIELVEELAGYALYAGNPFRKAVILYGKGGNGKSTLLRLFTALLGETNVSDVPLQALSEDRFSAADIFGKLANICGDLDARDIHRTDLFKQVTGGDPIRAQLKYRDAFSFTSYALPLFSANELPRTQDQTDAWFDRWIPIPFPFRFEGTPEDDVELSDKMRRELEGFLVLAVAGLQRLMRRGRFELPESVKLTLKQYRRTVDTVQAFLAEGWHLDPDGWVDRAELYCSYRTWCQDGGRLPLANVGFNTHLTQTYGDQVGRRTRIGRPGWVGLAAGGEEGDLGDVGDVLATLTYSLQSSHASVIRKGGEGITNITGVTGAIPSGTTAALPLGTNGKDPLPRRPPRCAEPGCGRDDLVPALGVPGWRCKLGHLSPPAGGEEVEL